LINNDHTTIEITHFGPVAPPLRAHGLVGRGFATAAAILLKLASDGAVIAAPSGLRRGGTKTSMFDRP
jgi:hypothetical protein